MKEDMRKLFGKEFDYLCSHGCETSYWFVLLCAEFCTDGAFGRRKFMAYSV